MCVMGIGTAIGSALGIGGTAAAGTAAGTAAGAGGFLQGLGTVLSAGGALYQGIAGARAANEQARALAEQRATEARLTATEDQRTRLKFRQAMRRQFAELASRGVALDSPSVIALGQTAAQELSFASQEVRSRGAARSAELSSSERIARGRARSSLLRGTFSAAGTVLNAAPDLWPELG